MAALWARRSRQAWRYRPQSWWRLLYRRWSRQRQAASAGRRGHARASFDLVPWSDCFLAVESEIRFCLDGRWRMDVFGIPLQRFRVRHLIGWNDADHVLKTGDIAPATRH